MGGTLKVKWCVAVGVAHCGNFGGKKDFSIKANGRWFIALYRSYIFFILAPEASGFLIFFMKASGNMVGIGEMDAGCNLVAKGVFNSDGPFEFLLASSIFLHRKNCG